MVPPWGLASWDSEAAGKWEPFRCLSLTLCSQRPFDKLPLIPRVALVQKKEKNYVETLG